MAVIYENPMSFRSVFLLLFGAWGKMGINCFVLITGYYMCKSHITLKKFCILLFEIEFYKIIVYLIFLLSGYQPFSMTALAKALLPVTSVGTGFTSCYLLFFLYIPFFNVLVWHLTQIQHIKLILLLGFIYVILGTIPKIEVTMNYVSWFSVIYLLGSYVRLYPMKQFDNTKLWGWTALISLALSAASVVAGTWLGVIINSSGLSYYFLADSNKVLAVITAFSGFMYFKNVRIKYSPLINTVAASTFGVLLIHANSDAMRQWLWKDMLDNVGMYSSPYMPLHAAGSVISIFAICVVIDYLRIRFIENRLFRLLDKRTDNIKRWYAKAENSICEKINIL